MSTLKQKAVAKDLLENVGKPVGQAMLDAGYSPATADNPDHLTESKGWAELMETMLPDQKLLLRHAEGLDATKVITSHTEPDYTVPDYAVRKQYVELGYRVKSKLKDGAVTPPLQIGGNTIIFANFTNETDS